MRKLTFFGVIGRSAYITNFAMLRRKPTKSIICLLLLIIFETLLKWCRNGVHSSLDDSACTRPVIFSTSFHIQVERTNTRYWWNESKWTVVWTKYIHCMMFFRGVWPKYILQMSTGGFAVLYKFYFLSYPKSWIIDSSGFTQFSFNNYIRNYELCYNNAILSRVRSKLWPSPRKSKKI